ncbi:MAG: hypothetical protein COT92_00835 [Candidatus Doudnabacteria bacterium CG10_big_fil_rev_8_21_14_0_10_42_18]|uniref:Gamma-glutamylcyclotransferase AIG2-like domain-containing protein n=1 Tax=Candidatus Doudnabacteria bacterium CG10_big_fil_rev_8_21_14_0_10_42_18 TaxID=1974552 RepID=A0A2H0VBK2_9BACT|nr:MAG: hypothetical protein COT92_00835 [Candidatus Doudnabacteria bacterium CG10_big_fil_rev_8_21_14_0_10_42_18]
MHYFAYGSNMDLALMRRLCGWHCHFLSRGLLEGYELNLGERGFGNIFPSSTESVYGVLFEVDDFCLKALDEFEDCPDIFERKELRVKDDYGNPTTAWVYIEKTEVAPEVMPNPSYWQRVLLAARENNLPKQWIEKIKQIANNSR